jgi:magnesium chelatase subunit D
LEASSSVSIAVTRADPGNPGPSSTGSGDSVDLETSEDEDMEEHEQFPGGTGGSGSAAHACTCDLDECPHRLDMPGRRRIDLDEALLHRMMEGFNPRLVTPRRERRRRDVPGKRSTAQTEESRGRYIRARHAGSVGRDIAFDATIRTAALAQHRRDRQGTTLKVEVSDLHAKIRERRVGNLLLFVVDCSGSMQSQRQILATQAATLSLLVDAYQRRDRVGLVAFRDQSAAVILRPTSSIELAKNAFRSLALGGPTPLSRGLLTAYELIQQELRREHDLIPVLILISDGCANVSMGDMRPGEEAALVGEMIRGMRIRSIVLGTAGQGWRMPDGSIFAPAQELAAAMGGEFYPMDETTAEAILAFSHRGAREPQGED